MEQSVANRRGKSIAPEVSVLCLYMLLLGFVLSRHEPWFDEAQAWLMARDLPYGDLVFRWMRYEGHLPLWHLLLSIPAKAGVPYEWGLKSVNFLCASAATAILLLRAPFPRPAKLLLPFTYFLFYQYGVISRCYSLLMLALWLSAAFYAARHERPIRFVLALMLLGGSAAYGMLMAFAVAFVWFLEMAGQARARGGALRRLLVDRRTLCLAALAAVHIFYVALLWPPADGFAPLSAAQRGWTESFNYVVRAPLEATFLDMTNYMDAANTALPWPLAVESLLVVAGFLWVMWFRRHFLLASLLLGSLFLFFFTQYYYIHHSGILWLSMLFLLWISTVQPVQMRALGRFRAKLLPYRQRLRAVGMATVGLVLAVQVFWAASAAFHDAREPYSAGRELAGFLKQHRMDQLRVFGAYETYVDGNGAFFAVHNEALPYFTDNILVNLNEGNRRWSFVQHRRQPFTQTKQRMKELAGEPDVIVAWSAGIVPYHDVLPIERYVKVGDFYGWHFWKASQPGIVPQCGVYLREDLLVRFPGLRPLPDVPLDQYKKLVSAKR